MKILLLEPDRILAGTYRQALQYAGHDVVMCASAQSAIFAADAFRPDVVVLELQLIEHSGIEFLYEFRSYPEWQSIPVIVQTTVPMREFESSWDMLKEQLGVHSYHYKPLTNLRTLMMSIQELASTAA